MNWHSLTDWASVSSVITGAIAVTGILAYVRTLLVWRTKSKRLEDFLRSDGRQRSMLAIISNVGLTQDEILQISFQNPRIKRRVKVDDVSSLAAELLFEYEADRS